MPVGPEIHTGAEVRRRKMKARILALIVVCLSIIDTTAAQGYSLSISPSGGPPGTTVILTTSPSFADVKFEEGQ